jgi:membrane-bound serine protease (ClpP class)
MVPESKKGLLLTVNGTEAHELKLAEPPVADFAELKQRLGIPAEQSVRTMQETWVDSLIFHLNNPAWAATLLTVAMICLFIELHFMTGVMAAISALCFALFFWSKYMGGTAGWLEVILFSVGVVCLGIEIFLLPGFGFFGIFGSVLTLLALVMASQTFGHTEPGRDLALLARNITTISLSIAAVVVIAAVLNRFLPHMPLMGQMVLTPPGGDAALGGPQLRPDLAGGSSDLLGVVGKAHSVLRPAGKAWLGDRLVDVVSDGPFIQAGTPVEVVQVNGNRIVVREVS